MQEDNEIKNGKDVVLQNLKTGRIEKNLKFIENEIGKKIIDLRSKQFSKYEIYNQNKKITFKTLKRNTLRQQLIVDHQKPTWLSNVQFKKFDDDNLTLEEKYDLVDYILKDYDDFMNRNYERFIRFQEKQLDIFKDKRQHILFHVPYLIVGKLDGGEEIRTPFLLEKIELNIDHNSRQVTIKSASKKEYLINSFFLTWLANKKERSIESDLKRIPYFSRFSEVAESKLLEIYNSLGISLKQENFENLPYTEIRLKKENISSKKDRETAEHEAKHLLIAYSKNAFIPYIEINNTLEKYGSILIENNNNIGKLSKKDKISIVIAPLSEQELKDLFNPEIVKIPGSDLFLIEEMLSEQQNDIYKNQNEINNLYEKNCEILTSQNYKIKFDLIVKYLLKHKSMEADEIIEQLNSNELIDSYYQDVNEQKFEKNTFFVEKTDAIAIFPNLEADKIYTDTYWIFENSDFVEKLLNETSETDSTNTIYDYSDFSNLSKHSLGLNRKNEISNDTTNYYNNELSFGESTTNINSTNSTLEANINWGYEADIHQQEALIKALNEKKVIIQGPPGTGKTQIILNIITNNIFKNKKTLILSEKITAVDVINKKIGKDEYLNNFIMDLYNFDEKRIHFYNNLSKILKIYNIKNKDSDFEFINSNYFNEYEDEKINNVSKRIKSVNEFLNKNKININEYLQILEYIPSKKENELIGNIDINDVKYFDKISTEKYIEIKKWFEERIFFIELSTKFNYQITQNVAQRVLKIQHLFNNYNEVTKLDSLFLLLYEETLTNKITKIFKKRKLKKWLNKNNLKKEEEFLKCFFLISNLDQNIDDFSKFIKFNFNKYSKQELDIYKKIHNLLSTTIKFSRLKEIAKYCLFIKNLNLVNNDFVSDSFFDFPLLNKKERLELGRNRAVLSYKHIIDDKLNNNLRFRKEIEGLEFRQKLTKKMRTFIFDNWDNLLTLFPVILATPENVSNHIPLEKEIFDTLVIDEASQMFLERSFPAIFRSKQIIIIGDKNQLKPLKIGERTGANTLENDKFEFESLVENESILDLFDFLIKNQNNLMLKTHYRSYFENLIHFSNKYFYENKLKFIEQNTTQFNVNNSIEIINVENGSWIVQRNEEEADKIIEKINDLFRQAHVPTIGVILFSKRQAGLVKEKLIKYGCTAARKSFNQLDESALFIKSIDQVQGEERDIIIFGIGYGKNAHNYGFLSREHGENRINVAASRAKKKIIIIKSHNANEYHINNTFQFKGAQTLINFIEFCEKVSNNENNLKNKNEPLLINKNNNFKEIITQLQTNQIHSKETLQGLQKLMKEFLVNSENHSIQHLQLKESIDFWFYFDNSNNFAYYLVDLDFLKNPKHKLWFYDEFLKVRKYNPKPIYFNELIKFIEKQYSN